MDKDTLNECKLSEKDLERLVELTIVRLTSKMYAEVGKKVITNTYKLLTYIGVVTISLYLLLKEKGIL